MSKFHPNDPYQPLIDNISDFLQDYSFRHERNIIDPEDLRFDRSVNRDGDDLYYEHLFPQFVTHAEDMDFDLYNWDRKKDTESFEQRLNDAVEGFNHYISPTVYGDTIYFVRCKPKLISGLPKDYDKREEFFESKALFTYETYSIHENDFLKLAGNYIRLYREYKSTIKQKSYIILTAVILGVIAYILIAGLFMT